MSTSSKAPFFLVFVVAGAVFGLAGCGGGNGVANGAPDLANFIQPASGPPETPDLAKACVADSDCQTSGSTSTTGASCCDVQSGTCYVSTLSVCPAPQDMAFTPSYGS